MKAKITAFDLSDNDQKAFALNQLNARTQAGYLHPSQEREGCDSPPLQLSTSASEEDAGLGSQKRHVGL